MVYAFFVYLHMRFYTFALRYAFFVVYAFCLFARVIILLHSGVVFFCLCKRTIACNLSYYTFCIVVLCFIHLLGEIFLVFFFSFLPSMCLIF